MTIRLTDVEAQGRYEREMEDYQKAVDKRVRANSVPTLSSDWPTPPKAPEPMVDSHDKESPSANPFALATMPSTPAFGRDPQFPGAVQVPTDGTSHTMPKGYETNWTSCEDAPAKPFTLKK